MTIGTTSASILIERPTISGVNAIWWLGGLADGQHGYYNQTLLTADPQGAPETPSWTVTANPQKISLDCSICATNVVRSQQASAPCQYDVKIKVTVGSFGGLSSDEFALNVNAPRYLELDPTHSPNPDDDPYDVLPDRGFKTTMRYRVRDMCGYLMTTTFVNEEFTYWFDDYPNQNWGHPQADGWAFQEPPYVFRDEMVWACSTQGCTPLSTNPQNPLSTVKVDHGGQIWRVGSAQVGSGVQVGANTQQWYVDHARHQ